MTNTNPTYLGPLPGDDREAPRKRERIFDALKRLPISFIVVVVAPTCIAAVYYLLVATPQYVSESRFVVRASSQETPSALGVALQGVGITSAQTDSFIVHEYVRSRDALRDLQGSVDVEAIISRPEVDPLSRFPRPWEKTGDEGLYKSVQRFVTVGYDANTGVSMLRVKAFRASDAKAMNEALLNASEQLVNRLNDRASRGAVAEAEQSVVEAKDRLGRAQVQLTEYRNREQLIDPRRTAVEGSELIGQLLSNVAVMRAERAQLAQDTPQNPQIAILDGRIRAYEQQIAAEREKIAGDAGSLAPKINTYEQLALERELADRALTAATQSLDRARLDARRQRLYLERVVSANLPDRATEPKRWRNLLTIFATLLLAFGTYWLVAAGLREHKQA